MAQTHWFTRDMPMHDIENASQAMPNMNGGQPIAKFFMRTVQDHAATAARGRYVGREIEMVRIIIPGDKHTIAERRVKPSDKIRFQKQYEAFRKQEEFVPDGTPLETWPLLSRAQVEDLKNMNVFSVENLANLSDEQLSNVGIGARTLRKHAKAFLETAEKGALPARMVEENERLSNQVERLSAQLLELTSRLESMVAKQGGKVEDVESPFMEAKQVLTQVEENKPVLHIPEDYKDMNLKSLKELCKQIANVPVMTKADAFGVIEDYLAEN